MRKDELNRCLIHPVNAGVGVSAESLERRGHCRFIRSNIASDLIIHVGRSTFHLHKVPMVSRSGYLNRMVFQGINNGGTTSALNIHIQNLPGGSKMFELVIKFCYGLPVELTTANVAPLYCAAHFLEMSEDMDEENLVSKTESFLSFIIFSSWKDTFQILKSCKSVSSCAKNLGIVNLCSESIVWKATLDPQPLTNEHKWSNKDQKVVESWWFEDVSTLRIDHFVEVINGFKAKKTQSKLVGDCIAYWTSEWLSKFNLGTEFSYKEVHRLTLETLIRILPTDGNPVSCNFLLHLLKLGLLLNIDDKLIAQIEGRLAMNLENCCVGDLVVKNHRNDHGTTAYDVDLVTRVVGAYVRYLPIVASPRMRLVAKLVDEYLALVAREYNLPIKNFQLLAEALPEDARQCNDKLYRAIDMYLKAHPTLTENERESVCKAMEYHKLSQEARNHAMKNDRLPSKVAVRFILLEQVDMNASMLANNRSNYRQSSSQAIVKVPRGPKHSWFKTNKELQEMKGEVEKIKVQLGDLQVCMMKLQRQVKISQDRRLVLCRRIGSLRG